MEKDMKSEIKKEANELATTDWKRNTLIIGAVAGALVGVAAAYLLLQRYGEDQQPDITLGEGIKIGMLVAGLLRSIATL